MNTGIGDAMNLGWKLAAELRGTAPGWLLDSYESERHPVGAAVLTEWCGPALPALVLDGDARGVRQRSERTNR